MENLDKYCSICKCYTNSTWHKNICPNIGKPQLSDSFAKNFKSFDEVKKWMSYPQNYFTGDLFIIKWNGLIPTFNKRLIDQYFADNTYYQVVLYEQAIRKKKGFIENV